jgi:hypothetical protein
VWGGKQHGRERGRTWTTETKTETASGRTPSVGVRARRFATGARSSLPLSRHAPVRRAPRSIGRKRSLRHFAAAISCGSDRSRVSRAFEFCGWWFRPVRLGPVPLEPRLGSPLRTPLNLHE